MVMKKSFSELQRNQLQLDACLKHRFEGPQCVPPYQIGTTFICKQCQGEMPALHVFAYVLGYAAAGKDANEVFEDFGDVWAFRNEQARKL
jgi:hypothetical protein